MKTKLKEYLDAVFADAERRAPYNEKLRELKEEMLCNLYDRYDDLLAEGRTPSAAYNIAVAGVGDISGLLDSVVGAASAAGAASSHTASDEDAARGKHPLTPEEQETLKKYKERSAVLTALSVVMYILCWLPLVVLSTVLNSDVGSVMGLTIMFLMIAGATGINIYNGMTKPSFAKGRDCDDDDDDDDGHKEKRSPLYKAISSALWLLTVVGYLHVSFATGAWHITWLIFLMTTAADNIIKAIFDLRRK